MEGKLTVPLSEEAATAFSAIFTDSFGTYMVRLLELNLTILSTTPCRAVTDTEAEWHEVTSLHEIARVVSRISTRIFMGEEMCRNEEWVDSVAAYSRAAFASGHELRGFPGFSRRIVHWFLPSAKAVRERLPPCRRLLQPVIEKRKALAAEALARGEPAPVFDDALTWFEKEYGTNYDPAIAQITLSIVAIDTTADLLQSTMLQLARHPEILQALRDEVVEVLSKQGLKKVALYNLKLMDSVLKETQRMKPVLAAIRRQASAEVRLSNGFVIRKGDRILVDNTNMWNATHYAHPEQFDPYRFLKWREEGNENIAHLVSTSDKHMGFGHGEHACPGRFFAANELKIALCHLVLKYEWKLPEGHDPEDLVVGSSIATNPFMRLLIRRREPEMDMATLAG